MLQPPEQVSVEPRTSALSTTLSAFAAEHVRGRRLSIDQSINQSINQLINHAFLDWSK